MTKESLLFVDSEAEHTCEECLKFLAWRTIKVPYSYTDNITPDKNAKADI